MIRRSTWIVFGVFVILALAAILLTRLPNAPLNTTPTTVASATPAPQVFPNWATTDINGVQLINGGEGQHYLRQEDGSWIDATDQTAADTGKVEQLLSELLALRVLSNMPLDFQLDPLGLTTPTQKIELTRQDGQVLTFSVGTVTPTGNGYYVRVDNQSPVVVSIYALEAALQIFTDLQATPTPEIDSTVSPTAAP